MFDMPCLAIVMPLMTEKRYDAIMFYLQSVKRAFKTKDIGWNSDPLLAYSKERYGDNYSFHNVSINAFKKRRAAFISNCSTYRRNETGDGLLSLDNKVNRKFVRPSQYDDILNELHDQAGHGGFNKLQPIQRN